VTSTETTSASETTDNSLHLIIDAVESNPPRPGEGVDVTLYLPWGAPAGSIEPCWYFDQKVLGYLQTVGIDHDRHDLSGRTDRKQGEDPAHASHEYVHLSNATYRLINGEVDRHDQLRVRLADVTAWTFGRGEHKGQ
jgi:hypothetical protein